MPRHRPLKVRFWEKVDRYSDPSGCWLWKGGLSPDGYGTIGIYRQPVERVHRVSWELHNGKIPDGLFVLHTCDVRNCVNPAHLFLGTNADNMADMAKKGRASGGTFVAAVCIYGHPREPRTRNCRECERIRGRERTRLRRLGMTNATATLAAILPKVSNRKKGQGQ